MFSDYMQRVSNEQLVEPCELNISMPAASSPVDDLISLPAGFIFALHLSCIIMNDIYMTAV